MRPRRERGQILVATALLLPVLLGFAALSIDIGSYSMQRRTLQNAADSIALAAAQELPDEPAATTAASDWAARNDIDPDDVSVTVSGGTTAPRVTVVIDRSHEFAFIRALGISESDVGARAVAGKFSFGGGSGVVPWSITQDTLDATNPGDLVTVKYDSTGGNNGNFGAIRIDGNGASDYQDAASYGSTTRLCAVSTPGCTTAACPGSFPSTCAETAPDCDGPECQPKTGNMTGPTRVAVDFRMSHTSTTCDTFDEVFDPADTGMHQFNPACNPWAGTGACPQTDHTSLCSRRVIIIPVIDEFGNGSSDPVEIQRFALLFLEGYDDGKCSGNSCEIKARFVNADVTTGGLAGDFDPVANVHFARLVE